MKKQSELRKGSADVKIAILSMQRIVNMGSVLQAYSLREMVEEVAGVQADFLDIEDAPALESRRSVKDSEDYAAPAAYSMHPVQRAKRKMISKLSARTKKLIRRFMTDELNLAEENSRKTYDHVIIGSDEVFNHVKGVRLQLHGSVQQAKNVFTYAASCGSAAAEDIAGADRPAVQQAMSRLSAISVRDEKTDAYVRELCGGETVRHLDPVLMGSLHKRAAQKVPFSKYLLVYAYGQRIRTEEEIGAIRAFAKKRGLKTVAIGGSQFWCDFYIPVSPMRALDYFHFADYVVTDTFHGAIFSIINRRRFAVIMRKTNQGKLTSLLSDLGLENRRVMEMSSLESTLESEICYDAVDVILERERRNARDYLKKQLMGEGPKLAGRGDCSACGACYAACPKHAIEMTEAKDGFKYPQINASLCIRCGLCEKICRAAETEVRNLPLQAFAAVGKNEEMVGRSASGGVFAAVANKIVAENGAATGAVMERDGDSFRVLHRLSGNIADLAAMQGSKYMQSDAWESFAEVAEAVKSGKQVLFSGTPCQVSALKRLTGDPDNLITADLICHGVPSARMFNDYAAILGRRFGGKLAAIRFRDKTSGKSYCAEIGISRGGKTHTCLLNHSLMSYYRLFLSSSICRENCYSCPYANLRRVSDFTIGDYWGVEDAHAEDIAQGRMQKRSDWSCILVNTEKGRKFVNRCADSMTLIESKPEWVAKKNEQLNAPSRRPENRDALMQSYAEGGYPAVERAFVQTHGGALRYSWRLIKNIAANRRKGSKK